jgi:hypothetical protein
MTWLYAFIAGASFDAVLALGGIWVAYRWGYADGRTRQQLKQAHARIRAGEQRRQAEEQRRQLEQPRAPWLAWDASSQQQPPGRHRSATPLELPDLAAPGAGPYLLDENAPRIGAPTAPRGIPGLLEPIAVPDDARELAP